MLLQQLGAPNLRALAARSGLRWFWGSDPECTCSAVGICCCWTRKHLGTTNLWWNSSMFVSSQNLSVSTQKFVLVLKLEKQICLNSPLLASQQARRHNKNLIHIDRRKCTETDLLPQSVESANVPANLEDSTGYCFWQHLRCEAFWADQPDCVETLWSSPRCWASHRCCEHFVWIWSFRGRGGWCFPFKQRVFKMNDCAVLIKSHLLGGMQPAAVIIFFVQVDNCF